MVKEDLGEVVRIIDNFLYHTLQSTKTYKSHCTGEYDEIIVIGINIKGDGIFDEIIENAVEMNKGNDINYLAICRETFKFLIEGIEVDLYNRGYDKLEIQYEVSHFNGYIRYTQSITSSELWEEKNERHTLN